MSVKSTLLSKVKGVVEDIAKKYDIGVEKIILFDSRARGDFKEGSD